MKIKSILIRPLFSAIALATLLVAPLGCAEVDEAGEPIGEAAEALLTPVLVASPSPLAFGTILHGTSVTLNVTLTNTGNATASSISVAIPPDPYRVAHNPPGFLDAGTASNVMQISFTPRTVGSYSTTLVVNYYGPGLVAPTHYVLNIPVTGTAN